MYIYEPIYFYVRTITMYVCIYLSIQACVCRELETIEGELTLIQKHLANTLQHGANTSSRISTPQSPKAFV